MQSYLDQHKGPTSIPEAGFEPMTSATSGQDLRLGPHGPWEWHKHNLPL